MGTLEVQLSSGSSKTVPYLLELPKESTEKSSDTAVCLLHGASGDASSGNLPALARACAAAGLPCLRLTCRGGSLEHRIAVTKAVLDAAPTLSGLAGVARWVLAGHSMGARVAAAIAGDPAWHPSRVVAVVLSSFPLHPPGRPQELRDALLHGLRLPALLVRGDRDPFSQQAKWEAALDGMSLACAWREHTVEGGDHSLRLGGKDGAARSQAALQGACAAVQQFLSEVAQEQPAAHLQQQQQRQQPQHSKRAAAARQKKLPAAGAASTAAATAAAAPKSGAKRARKAAAGRQSAKQRGSNRSSSGSGTAASKRQRAH